MKNKTHLLLALLVFVLSSVYLLFFINIYQGGDEGFLLTGAERLLRGEVLYRDFHHFLTPGAFVLLAALFKIFGVHILVARIVTLLFGALLVTLTYLLAEKLLKNWYLAFLPSAMILVAGFPTWFLYSHHWLSSTLALTAIYFLVLGEEFSSSSGEVIAGKASKERWLYLASGFFTALTLFFMQNKGLGLIIFLAACLLLFSSRPRANFKIFSAGCSLGLGLLLLYLLKNGTSVNFFYYTFWWPLINYAQTNVPYFNLGKQDLWQSLSLQKQLFVNFSFSNLLLILRAFCTGLFLLVLGYLSVFAVPSAFIWGWKLKRREPRSNEARLLGLYALASLAFFISSWHRPDFIHLVFGASLPLILFFYFIQKGIGAVRLFPQAGKVNIIRPAAASALFLVIAVIAAGTFYRGEYYLAKRFKNPYYAIETSKGRQWTDSPTFARDYNFLIPYLKANLQPREPFIVMYYQSIVYFFTDARNPLKTDTFGPEYNNPEEFNRILETIKQKRVRYILKDSYVDDVVFGKYAFLSPHINRQAYVRDPVRLYIEENYQPLFILNHFTLYRLKSLSAAHEK